MRKKKQNKKIQVVESDASEDNSDGSTTPQGYTARVKSHQGVDYMGHSEVNSEYQALGTSHQSSGI